MLGKKQKTIVAAVGINIGIVFTSLVIGCVAWFASSTNLKGIDVKSSVITSYFDCRRGSDGADGTLNNPYVISKPIHYYNLVELHDQDKTFNIEGQNVKFYEAGFYFEFGKDIDGDGDKEFYSYSPDGVIIEGETTQFLNMEYYHGDNALHPLGNAEKPFKSHIIGNNLTVQGLHISGEGHADIGVFGFVDSDASIKNLYFDSVDIDVKNPDLSEYNELYHATYHDVANVGYIAGHVQSDDSFDHVYVNNCDIRNSVSNSVKVNNDYGYFGFAECNSTPVPSGEGATYEFNPNKVYDYLDQNYSNLAGDALRLRNDYHVPSGTVSDAIQKSNTGGTHYTLAGTSDGSDYNYPLANIGYEEGNAVNNVWYKSASSYESIPSATTLTEDAPGELPGTFFYYNGETWDYYVCIQDTERKLKPLLCNTIYCVDSRPDQSQEMYKWYWNMNNKHWLQIDSSNSITISPNSGDYFTFIENPGDFDTNQSNQLMSNVNRTCYILNIKNGEYMYVQKDTLKLVFGSFGDCIDSSKSVACKFTMTAVLGGTISFKIGANKYYLYYNQSTLKAGLAGTCTPSYFYLSGDGCNEYSPSWNPNGWHGDAWEIVTNPSQLQNNDKIIFAYASSYNSSSFEVMGGRKSTNYRKSVSDDAIKGYIVDSAELGRVTVKRNSDGTFSFYDDSNGGYFYAASSNYDYLRTQLRNDDLNSHFSVSIGSNRKATITAQGGAEGSTHNLFRYDPDKGVFSCYAEGKQDVYIFKFKEGGNPDRLCVVQCNPQDQYGYYGGVASVNKFNVYYSDRPLSEHMNDNLAHRLVDGPDILGEPSEVFSFDAYEGDSGFDSTSIVEMPVGGGGGGGEAWVKCTDKADITDGGEYLIAVYSAEVAATAGPVINGYMNPVTNSVFKSNGRLIANPDPDALQFTLHGTSNAGWVLETQDNYLGCEQLGVLNLESAGETRWSINIDPANGYANIVSQDSECGQIAFNQDNVFTTSRFQSQLFLYKKSSDVHNVSYIADGIALTDLRYDCSRIDTVGNVSFYKNGDTNYYALLNQTNQIVSVKEHERLNDPEGKTGDQFYSSFSCPDSLVFKIPNTGSLDFGTITITGEGEAPDFIKGFDFEDGKTIGFDDNLIRCPNTSPIAGHFEYVLSLNIYNIYNLCYAALDEEGKIISSYDSTSDQLTPDQNTTGYITQNQISNFILCLADVKGSEACKITKASYEFHAAQGNMANFGKVGYRTAVYEGGDTDNLGNEVKEDISQVKGPILNFEYLLNAGTFSLVSVTYSYDSTYEKYIYEITFKSSVAMNVIVFNYDAQRELVKVNGVLQSGAYNDVPIAASTPPTGGWQR